MKIDKFNVGTSQSENKSENPNNWLFRTLAAQKVKFSIRKFFTFTEEVLNGKLHFCAVNLIYHQNQSWFS